MCLEKNHTHAIELYKNWIKKDTFELRLISIYAPI